MTPLLFPPTPLNTTLLPSDLLQQNENVQTHYANVTSVHFSPTAPHVLAAAASTRVRTPPSGVHARGRYAGFLQHGRVPRNDAFSFVLNLLPLYSPFSSQVHLYDPKLQVEHKAITRYKDVALSCRFRPDGRLLAGGDASGLVQVFDLSSRSVLRRFRGHKG